MEEKKGQIKNFLKEFISEPLATGALSPSSREMGEMMVDSVNLSNARSVVELGPGNGVLTEVILSHLNPETTFFCIELNANFAELTRKRCPGVLVYEDSAEYLPKYLQMQSLKSTDVIFSALPWGWFNDELQNTLLEAVISSLKSGGEFISLMYVHSRPFPQGLKFQKLLKKNFATVTTTKTIWKNIPPAMAYHCVKA